jgi:hypothetical protein
VHGLAPPPRAARQNETVNTRPLSAAVLGAKGRPRSARSAPNRLSLSANKEGIPKGNHGFPLVRKSQRPPPGGRSLPQ